MHVILKKFLGHTNRKTDKVSYRSSFPELKKVQVISTSILSGLSWRRIFNPPPTQSPHFLRGGGWGGGRGVKILFQENPTITLNHFSIFHLKVSCFRFVNPYIHSIQNSYFDENPQITHSLSLARLSPSINFSKLRLSF